jgi:imidazolonepropionase-like amidohydrolase
MQEADVNIRDAIGRGLMPGPRLFVATRVLASTGSYEPRTENHIGGTCLPAGADAVDGPDECRKAVRRRIGYGADIIKFYADTRRRIMRFPPKQPHPYIPSIKFQPPNPNPEVQVYADDEMEAIVDEANRAQAPVACHAMGKIGIIAASKAGALSIEHGFLADDETIQILKENDTILVPTMAVLERLFNVQVPAVQAMVVRAHAAGVRLACGGDTGTFPLGENAREMELFVEGGLPWEEVLSMGTVGGWEACGGDRCGFRFGWFEEGCTADIVALDTDPREDHGALRKVSWVIKDGRVWKKNNEAVGMIDIGKSPS